MTAKLCDFSTVFRENFKVVVICNSTMTLPWQPSFDSIVFQNLHFVYERRFYFYYYLYYI